MISWGLIAVIIGGLLATIFALRVPVGEIDLLDLIQVLEAGINDVVLIGLAIFFLVSLEGRIKRRRALEAVHELRSIAHTIDMHQLTKDPGRIMEPERRTKSSPELAMTPFEMNRFLDYCSEMLSLTGKVAALYVAKFNDPVALASVNEVENLTTGLSRKIWQKLIILHGMDFQNSA